MVLDLLGENIFSSVLLVLIICVIIRVIQKNVMVEFVSYAGKESFVIKFSSFLFVLFEKNMSTL